MRIVWIIAGILVLMNLMWHWVAIRQSRSLPRSHRWRWALWGFNLMMLGSLAWLFAGRLVTDFYVQPRPLISAIMIWFMLVLPATLVMLALAGIGRLAVWLARQGQKRLARRPAAQEALPIVNPGRRQFLASLAVSLPPVVTLGATGVAMPQLQSFRVREIEVPLPGLPVGLDGLTIAHLSDTHVGQFTNGRVLDRFVEATNTIDHGQPADLVMVTGDVINNSNRDLPPAIDMLQRLQARHGVYVCEGNHDLIDDGAVFVEQIRQAGIHLLRNEIADVQIAGQHVQVLGLIWGPPGRAPSQRARSNEAQIQAAVEQLDQMRHPDAFSILLAHHPHAFDPAAEAGIPLTLAGHTHGGQLHLTDELGFGPYMYRYWSGLYEKPSQQAACVISNGAGNWFPLRINAPAEIIRIRLRTVGGSPGL